MPEFIPGYHIAQSRKHNGGVMRRLDGAWQVPFLLLGVSLDWADQLGCCGSLFS